MNDDPDTEAMANRPLIGADDDSELMQMDVTEGGASGGLFMADDDSSDDDDRPTEGLASPGLDRRDSQVFADEMAAAVGASDDEEEEDDDDDAEEEEDDEDPIVKTFDIFATKRLGEHLHLFQYPIRPPGRQYLRAEQPSGARMKPRCGQIEIEVPIAESAHYDARRATQWTEEPLRQHLIGGTIRKGRNYLIGVIRDDELHVTPLKGIAQLRPSFSYIDARDAEEKEAKKSDALAERAPRAAKAVQLSAKSSDAVPDLSTTSLIRAAEEENWTRLQWQVSQSNEAQSIFKHLFTTKKNVVCEAVTDKVAYLDMLSTIKMEEQQPPPVSEQPVKKAKK